MALPPGAPVKSPGGPEKGHCRGIDCCSQVHGGAVSPEKEAGMARELARRRWRAYRKDDRYSARRKLIAYLGRRGFDYSTIRTVLSEIFTDEFNGDPEDIS